MGKLYGTYLSDAAWMLVRLHLPRGSLADARAARACARHRQVDGLSPDRAGWSKLSG